MKTTTAYGIVQLAGLSVSWYIYSMKILKGIAKVALVILALPWVLVILGKVLSGSVINAYLAYASWVAGIAKSW